MSFREQVVIIQLNLLQTWENAQIHQTAQSADRKSTRLNSSHSQISYAVFCLKKKKKTTISVSKCPKVISVTSDTLYQHTTAQTITVISTSPTATSPSRCITTAHIHT